MPGVSASVSIGGGFIPGGLTNGGVGGGAPTGKYNALQNGLGAGAAAGNAAALATLAASLPAAGATIYWPAGTYRIDGNVTTPSNVSHEFAPGAQLVIDAGQVVTINGPILAAPTQIFGGAGGVAIGFGNVPEFYPQWWGARADGNTDDTAAIQRAINAAQAFGGVVYLSASTADYKTSAPLVITAPVSLVGGGRGNSGLICVGCDGLSIAAGVSFVTVQNLRISQAVRYTTAPNALTGIKISGTTAQQCYRHIYRDVVIDGFETGIIADGVCSTRFDNVEVVQGKHGLSSAQQTLNNTLDGCRFSGGQIAGGVGIKLGDGSAASDAEGWMISKCLTFQYARGVWFNPAAYCKVTDCVLDYNSEYGVLLQSGLDAVAAVDIVNNYIGLTGGGAVAGIACNNAVGLAVRQDFGHQIRGNVILTYVGSVSATGILISGATDDYHVVDNNRVWATTQDLKVTAGGNHRITNNRWQNNGYLATVANYYEGNTGPIIASIGASIKQSSYLQVRATPVYGAAIQFDVAGANEFDITVTNGAAFTIQAPTSAIDGKRITVTIRNGFGALGVLTWDPVFKLAAWTQPAVGFSRSIDFKYNGASWVEVSRTMADVPN